MSLNKGIESWSVSSSVAIMMVDVHLGFEHFDFGETDSLALKVVIMLERGVSGGEVVVGGTVVLLEARVLLSLTQHALQHSPEVEAREQSVVGHEVVSGVGLVVVQVLE